MTEDQDQSVDPAVEEAPVGFGKELMELQPGAGLVPAGGGLETPTVGPPPLRPPAKSIRRDKRVGPPPRHPQWLLNQLPVGMLESDFFVRFVALFQDIGGSLLDDADTVTHVPDVSVTPVPMLSYLAGWIGVDVVDASMPEQVQRVIVASSSKALSRRGTVAGLRDYLETLSEGPAEVTDGGGVWRESEAPTDFCWVRMQVIGTGHLVEEEFVSLVRDEIPAHVRAELWIGDRRVFSTEEHPA